MCRWSPCIRLSASQARLGGSGPQRLLHRLRVQRARHLLLCRLHRLQHLLLRDQVSVPGTMWQCGQNMTMKQWPDSVEVRLQLRLSCCRLIKLSSPRMNTLMTVGCVLSYVAVVLYGVDLESVHHAVCPVSPRVDVFWEHLRGSIQRLYELSCSTVKPIGQSALRM